MFLIFIIELFRLKEILFEMKNLIQFVIYLFGLLIVSCHARDVINFLLLIFWRKETFYFWIKCFKEILEEKIEQLTEWSLKKPVIRLNFEKFKHFVRTPPKNYSIVVMLTALGAHRDCQICR